MSRFVGFILRNRIAVIVLCALLSLLAVASLSRAVVASSVGKLFLGESPEYLSYLERNKRFGTDQIVVVGLDDPDFLSPAGQERLRAATTALEALPVVSRVRSVLDARRPRPSSAGAFDVLSYAVEARRHPQRVSEIQTELSRDPLFQGVLVSYDGTSCVVFVELTQEAAQAVEKGPRIAQDVRECLAAAGYADGSVYLAGLFVVFVEVVKQTIFNFRGLFPFVCAILLVTVWILFRRFWPAAIALGVALVGSLWTMGFAVLLDPQLNILMGAVPAIILVVSFSDVVHLCSAYLLELDERKDRDAAILAAGEDVGKACLFTSLTTFVGFVCLSFVPSPAFRMLGVVLGFGVAIALLLAMTLVPIIFSFMPAPKPLRAGPTAWAHRALDAMLAAGQQISTRHPGWTVAAFGLVLAVSIAGLSQLEIDTDLDERLDASNRVRMDQKWFTNRFAGSNFLELYVHASRPEALADPEWFGRVAEFQQAVRDLPEVDAALSLVDLVASLHDARSQAATGGATQRPSSAELSRTMTALKIGGGEELSRFVDFDHGLLRIGVQTTLDSFREISALGTRVKALGGKLLEPAASVEVTGIAFLLGDWLDEILKGQERGLAHRHLR